MLIDLHTHSNHSDGTQPPAEVVRSAADAGLDVLALTDHDVTSGWAEAGEEALALGLVLVPGVEVSCRRAGVSIHLLAYLPDPRHTALAAELAKAREHRVSRMRLMVDRLAADGFPVTFDDVLAQLGEEATMGRPHLADALVAVGRYPDRSAAFADVLHSHSPYYVGHYAPDPALAVELVRSAGGVPVLAHGFAAGRGTVVGRQTIADMVDAGMAGVEVAHRDHTPAQREEATEVARHHGLLMTGGSDYHGSGKPNRLGEQVTTRRVLEDVIAAASGTDLIGSLPG